MKTVRVPRSLVENDQIPSGVREAIHQLFTNHAWPASKCDRMLESLLPYAQIEKTVMEQNERSLTSAKIIIHNLLKTYHTDHTMQEACCYQTLHIFIRLLCALGILRKQSGVGQPTTYFLPLDPEYCFQNPPTILAAVDRLCDPQRTKNAKLRKKAREVKFRLVLMNPVPQNKTSANLTTFPVALQQSMLERISNLVDSLQLSPSTTVILAKKITDVCANVLHQEATMVVSACVEISSSGGDFSSVLSAQESTRTPYPVDSHTSMQITESPGTPYSGASLSRFPERRCASSEHEKGQESTNEDKNLPNDAPSSIDSIYIDKNSSQKELELESKTEETWIGSEEELSQEAVRYLRLLDGPDHATPEYLSTHIGKKALGGYKNKIRRSPQLAHIAAINTLLQRTFYDLTKQKKPLENAGKWFHSSFDRYADQQRPMEVIGEILDWAKSPYTLEEIASVLLQERKRQKTQWWSSESPHLPFASCVALYHHLPIKVQGPPELSTIGGAMNGIEAEQLADEIRQEASWYLEQIQVREKGENVYVVEAYIADTLFPVTYTSRQDWQEEHQHQIRHRMREQPRGDACGAHP